MSLEVTVIGGGLAGVESAYALANRGIKVTLYDQKPIKFSPAHKSENLCELICSNSLKAERLNSAGGLLKAEMELLDSLTVKVAKETRVPAGGSLSVDRDAFSSIITEKIKSHENINFISKEITKIPNDTPVIIATGPLTEGDLYNEITKLCGERLSFFDAVAPIVTGESIDMDCAFYASRYDRGGETDYINCPLEKDEYLAFIDALTSGEKAKLHGFEKDITVYEGCMPIEIMASRGVDTARFGPMKPTGLTDPKTGRWPYAVVQLRREDNEGRLFNLVGFQTNLKFGEQKRIFSMIPALKNAEFVRYGVMHRNTFIDSPKLLNPDFSMRSNENIYFAGQITGVEGYMESAASGLIAGINLANKLNGKNPLNIPKGTMLYALTDYISHSESKNFQPMGANFGIIPPLDEKIKNKQERYTKLSNRAIDLLTKALKGADVK